jgi:hypothetical protein
MYWFFFICGSHASCKTINCSILILDKKTRSGCSEVLLVLEVGCFKVELFIGLFLTCGGFETSILHQQDLHGWGSIALEKLTFEMRIEQF